MSPLSVECGPGVFLFSFIMFSEGRGWREHTDSIVRDTSRRKPVFKSIFRNFRLLFPRQLSSGIGS